MNEEFPNIFEEDDECADDDSLQWCNPKKIIAISATQGSGKTTMVYSLAAHLKKLGKNVVVLNELARECPFAINQVGEDRTQLWLIGKQITRELELMACHDYVIVDRSIIDAVAYARVIGETNWLSNKFNEYLADYIRQYYYYIFLLNPVAFNYNVEDGVRDTDIEFRMKVHDSLVEVFRSAQLPIQEVYEESEIFDHFT